MDPFGLEISYWSGYESSAPDVIWQDVIAGGLILGDLILGGPTGEGIVPAAAILATKKGFKEGCGAAFKNKTKSGYGVTNHSVNQKINRLVKSSDELDALKNPIKVNPTKLDHMGRPSQRYIGRKAEVAINPETGKVVSVNPTSKKKIDRILRSLGK